MSEPEEDFAALFEASVQAMQYERGQTVEGTIVAIGPEVAFVNVGGKGEAIIEIAELTNADGVWCEKTAEASEFPRQRG